MIALILLVFAFVCFTIAAVWTNETYRGRLVAAGLSFLAASMLFGRTGVR